MKVVLFAWELGGGFGHIASIRRYAQRLAAHDVRMVAAVRRPKLAQALADIGVKILQAPPWPEASFTPKEHAATSSATLGDSLASAGLADVDAMSAVLRGWTEILQSVSPDLVIADYAPAAALASRGRVPLMLVGNGYTVPPSDMTHFPLLHRERPPVWDEMRLLTTVNKAGRQNGIEPLQRLPELFSANEYVVDTFALLDPYDLQRTALIDGPSFDNAPIARREDVDRILVYLAPGYKIHPGIADALLPIASRVQIYAPSLSILRRQQLRLAGAQVHRQQVNLAEAVAHARMVVHFGGSGLAAHAMAAGVPQLILSTHIEQELNGAALERAGLGKLVRGHDRNAKIPSSIVSDMLDDDALANRAAQSGVIHREMLRTFNPLAGFEARSLKLLQL